MPAPSVPGKNLLVTALKMLGTERMQWRTNLQGIPSPGGQYTPLRIPVPGRPYITGSLQPETLSSVHANGYVSRTETAVFYVDAALMAPDVMRLNDLLVRGDGTRWEVTALDNWYGQDGWVCATLVRVDPAPGTAIADEIETAVVPGVSGAR